MRERNIGTFGPDDLRFARRKQACDRKRHRDPMIIMRIDDSPFQFASPDLKSVRKLLDPSTPDARTPDGQNPERQ